MAVSDDVKNAVDSLKKITDTIDKIEAVERDIRLMLGVTKFTDGLVRVSIDNVVNGLVGASNMLKISMTRAIAEISRVQGGP